MIRALALAICVLAVPAVALELGLPSNAQVTAERNSTLDSYALPVSGFGPEGLRTVTLEGEVRRTAWRIASPGLTPLQILAPLRDQLKEAGFEIALDCDQSTCGGFDFRFATEVLPAPNMYVNIRAFRFVSAHLGPVAAPSETLSLLVSTSTSVAYVQIIRAGTLDPTDLVDVTGAVPQAAAPVLPTPAGFESLMATGSLPLSELEFATGSSDLGPGPFPVLAKLADLMAARRDIRLALVGHTDSVGSLDGNIALSKRRAQSVRQRLIDTYRVDPARLDAEGMGYLAPAASHLTPEGREVNRRVEVILLPSE